ncbi:hypothetical protein PCE1_001609 [Barthelona sp. PCE]
MKKQQHSFFKAVRNLIATVKPNKPIPMFSKVIKCINFDPLMSDILGLLVVHPTSNDVPPLISQKNEVLRQNDHFMLCLRLIWPQEHIRTYLRLQELVKKLYQTKLNYSQNILHILSALSLFSPAYSRSTEARDQVWLAQSDVTKKFKLSPIKALAPPTSSIEFSADQLRTSIKGALNGYMDQRVFEVRNGSLSLRRNITVNGIWSTVLNRQFETVFRAVKALLFCKELCTSFGRMQKAFLTSFSSNLSLIVKTVLLQINSLEIDSLMKFASAVEAHTVFFLSLYTTANIETKEYFELENYKFAWNIPSNELVIDFIAMCINTNESIVQIASLYRFLFKEVAFAFLRNEFTMFKRDQIPIQMKEYVLKQELMQCFTKNVKAIGKPELSLEIQKSVTKNITDYAEEHERIRQAKRILSISKQVVQMDVLQQQIHDNITKRKLFEDINEVEEQLHVVKNEVEHLTSTRKQYRDRVKRLISELEAQDKDVLEEYDIHIDDVRRRFNEFDEEEEMVDITKPSANSSPVASPTPLKELIKTPSTQLKESEMRIRRKFRKIAVDLPKYHKLAGWYKEVPTFPQFERAHMATFDDTAIPLKIAVRHIMDNTYKMYVWNLAKYYWIQVFHSHYLPQYFQMVEVLFLMHRGDLWAEYITATRFVSDPNTSTFFLQEQLSELNESFVKEITQESAVIFMEHIQNCVFFLFEKPLGCLLSMSFPSQLSFVFTQTTVKKLGLIHYNLMKLKGLGDKLHRLWYNNDGIMSVVKFRITNFLFVITQFVHSKILLIHQKFVESSFSIVFEEKTAKSTWPAVTPAIFGEMYEDVVDDMLSLSLLISDAGQEYHSLDKKPTIRNVIKNILTFIDQMIESQLKNSEKEVVDTFKMFNSAVGL